MAAVAAIVDLVTKCFSSSESPCHANASHKVFVEQMRFEDFQDGRLDQN